MSDEKLVPDPSCYRSCCEIGETVKENNKDSFQIKLSARCRQKEICCRQELDDLQRQFETTARYRLLEERPRQVDVFTTSTKSKLAAVSGRVNEN